MKILAAFMLILGGCTLRERAPNERDASLKIQLSTEPASLDPALAEDGASLRVLYNTMEGLVGYDGGGVLQHLLAESHSVSSDGRRYEFTLRKNLRWSDGRPVMVADFITGFRRALHPGSGSKLAGSFFPIRGARAYFEGKGPVEAVAVREENGRLVLELLKPAPYFIQALSLPVAMPERQDILDASGGKWPETAPCTGPYRITRHQAERKITFEKNPFYWNPSPEFPTVELIIVSEEATGLNLFEQGKLDVLTKIPSSELPRLRRAGVIQTDPFLATYYLSFNFKKPPFDDRLWRQAVSSALRREELVTALGSGDTPARSWVPPGLEGYVSYAKPRLISPTIIAGIRKEASASAPLIAAFDTSQRNTMIMEKVEHDLRSALGLRLSLSNLDWKTYLKTLQTDPPPIFRLGILSPFLDPIQILETFTTGDPANYLKWSNSEYDRLVQEISVMKAGPSRADKVRRAQAVLVDDEAIVVPLYHYVQNHAVSRRVEGFRVNPFGVIRFHELRIKK